ncbi:Immunoglobulin super DCC subclass member 3 [Sparganum proliferum]
MSSLRWLILLQTFTILAALDFAEHSSHDDFEICSSELEPCNKIKKINGTFDTFNKCAFQCDGWPKLENSVEETVYFCTRGGYCEDATFFVRPGTTNGFEQLMTCFNSCMSGLVPTEFTATALNSSAIRVTWKKPRRSGELSGKYELIVDSSTREDQLYIHATNDIIGDFEPSTTYNLTVRAFWSNGTPVDAVAFTTVTTRPREVHTVPVYKLCKKEHEECEFVPYREKDTTKGKGCREACAKQRGGLSETMTVYFCEEPNKTCTPYEVYGRAEYAENFERHFKCVSLCHLVGRGRLPTCPSGVCSIPFC